MPVRDVQAACAFYRERLGFRVRHQDLTYAVLERDKAEVHLWQADDETWRSRADLGSRPVCSGAESFLAGTASFRVQVADVDTLYSELRAADVLHPVSRDGVSSTDFGTREFACLDIDGNQIAFFRWTP